MLDVTGQFMYPMADAGTDLMELGIRSSGPTAEGLVIYAIGFDISTPAQAANMAAKLDGAIVGSAIVQLCA